MPPQPIDEWTGTFVWYFIGHFVDVWNRFDTFVPFDIPIVTTRRWSRMLKRETFSIFFISLRVVVYISSSCSLSEDSEVNGSNIRCETIHSGCFYFNLRFVYFLWQQKNLLIFPQREFNICSSSFICWVLFHVFCVWVLLNCKRF